MNYNLNNSYYQNYNNSRKTNKKGCLIIVIIAIAFFAITAICNWLPSLFVETNYFNESFRYENLEITVTEAKEIDKENGSFLVTITFYAKNIGDKTNSFDLDDVYLKNVKTKKEYTRAELFSHENIKAGESVEYKVEYTIPTSIISEKYILCFDFDTDSNNVAKCALYYENGDMLNIETTGLYYDNNIQVLSERFGAEMAEGILDGLEKTRVIKSNTCLNSDWIIYRGKDTMEIYSDISVIISGNKEQFKIYTFETVYKEGTDILLYDSTKPDKMKVLTETERENLRMAQRKYQVQHTINISPESGALSHDKYGNTYFSFTVRNRSDSAIVYLEITSTPYVLGVEKNFNKKTYTSWDEIQVRERKSFELRTTGWNNYDSAKITNVVVMFEDGTSIVFDEYDCQFLSD